jgi:membrane protein
MSKRVFIQLRPTLRYLMETEVHVYSFSIAANVLLSFFPFLLVMVSVCRYVLHWHAGERAIYLGLSDYFPGAVGEFIRYNLSVTARPIRWVSILMLLFTANGIFEPLEVALNRAWHVTKNRSFFRNQLVSLGLIFTCGGLALSSITLTALNRDFWSNLSGPAIIVPAFVDVAFFKMAAVPFMVLMLFLIYWLLPNRKVPPLQVIPVAAVVGLTLEIMKYVNLWTWPYLRSKLSNEVGPFVYSVSIVFWSFFASMIVLAGAEWSARWGLQPSSTGTSQIANVS